MIRCVPATVVGVVGGLSLFGCTSFASLPRPTFFASGPLASNCRGTLAVDARGDVWNESGCEARTSGVRHQEHLTRAQDRAFRKALEVLVQMPDLPLPAQPECAGSWESLSLVRTGMPNREWYVCRTNDGHRPPPFEAVFEAIR